MKKIVTLGEVLMRLSPPGKERLQQAHELKVHFGGAEANVAASLSQLGQNATHVSAFPDHQIGTAAIHFLRSNGVDTAYCLRVPESRMGIYFYEKGAMQRPSRVVYDRYQSAFSHINPSDLDWSTILSGADWFHWTGITPALSAKAAETCQEALTMANKLGVTVSADINYRSNLWKYGKKPEEVMPALMEKSQVVVSGPGDLAGCLGVPVHAHEEMLELMKKNFPAVSHIVSTHRETVSASENYFSASMWAKGAELKSKRYLMNNIIDRIGGGDAFMAGLIYGILHKEQAEALDFAVAASVLKHSIPGDLNLVEVSEIEALVHDKETGRLRR